MYISILGLGSGPMKFIVVTDRLDFDGSIGCNSPNVFCIPGFRLSTYWVALDKIVNVLSKFLLVVQLT